jgi:hypothetical protein
MPAKAWLTGSLVSLALLSGCGSSKLGEGDVTNLPPGDATGAALSGIYQIEIYTSACSGNCPLIDLGWATLSTCDVGDRDSQTVSVLQQDGRLTIDGAGLLVPRLQGGVDQDGSFRAGGMATQQSGAIRLYSLAEGQVSPQGALSSTTRTRAVGTVSGTSLDCTGTYDVSGARL